MSVLPGSWGCERALPPRPRLRPHTGGHLAPDFSPLEMWSSQYSGQHPPPLRESTHLRFPSFFTSVLVNFFPVLSDIYCFLAVGGVDSNLRFWPIPGWLVVRRLDAEGTPLPRPSALPPLSAVLVTSVCTGAVSSQNTG